MASSPALSLFELSPNAIVSMSAWTPSASSRMIADRPLGGPTAISLPPAPAAATLPWSWPSTPPSCMMVWVSNATFSTKKMSMYPDKVRKYGKFSGMPDPSKPWTACGIMWPGGGGVHGA